MGKLVFFFFCFAAFQLIHGFDEDLKDPISSLDVKNLVEEGEAGTDEGEERGIADIGFTVLKKVIRIEPLKCNGASCSGCLGAFGKGGCIKVAYNKLPSKKAELFLELSVNNKPRWSGRIKTGKAVPSCVKFADPIKTVCFQDFTCSVAENAIPTGDICFTINFKDYHLGVNFCGYFAYGSFVPLIIPSIKKT